MSVVPILLVGPTGIPLAGAELAAVERAMLAEQAGRGHVTFYSVPGSTGGVQHATAAIDYSWNAMKDDIQNAKIAFAAKSVLDGSGKPPPDKATLDAEGVLLGEPPGSQTPTTPP